MLQVLEILISISSPWFGFASYVYIISSDLCGEVFMSYIYFCLFLKMFYIFCLKLGTGTIPAYYYSVTSRSYVNSCHCLCSNKMTALNSSTLTKQLATLIIGLGVAPTVCVWLSVRTRLPQCVEVLYICEQVRGSDGPPRWQCEWCQLSLLNHWQLLSPWWLLLSPALNVYLLPFTLEQ